jgi:hypothetical protein
MQAMPCLFKTFTNFIIREFEKLPQLVVSTIIGHAKVDKERHVTFPSNLNYPHNNSCSVSSYT